MSQADTSQLLCFCTAHHVVIMMFWLRQRQEVSCCCKHPETGREGMTVAIVAQAALAQGHCCSNDPSQQCKTAWVEVHSVFRFVRTCLSSFLVLPHAAPSPHWQQANSTEWVKILRVKTSTFSPVAIGEGAGSEGVEAWSAVATGSHKSNQGVFPRSVARGGHVCSTGGSRPFGEGSWTTQRGLRNRHCRVHWSGPEPESQCAL